MISQTNTNKPTNEQILRRTHAIKLGDFGDGHDVRGKAERSSLWYVCACQSPKPSFPTATVAVTPTTAAIPVTTSKGEGTYDLKSQFLKKTN